MKKRLAKALAVVFVVVTVLASLYAGNVAVRSINKAYTAEVNEVAVQQFEEGNSYATLQELQEYRDASVNGVLLGQALIIIGAAASGAAIAFGFDRKERSKDEEKHV